MNHFGSALGACVLCACIPQAFPPLSTMPRKNRKKTSTSKAGPAGARSQAVPVLTLLALASDGRHSEIARLVNGGGIDNINEAGEGGWTALLLACREGHSEVVQVLLSAGASVDQANNDGATPFVRGMPAGPLGGGAGAGVCWCQRGPGNERWRHSFVHRMPEGTLGGGSAAGVCWCQRGPDK